MARRQPPEPAHTSPRHPKQVTVRTQKVISLPGVGGHGDVVTVDPAAHTAYIAHSPDNDVVVLDTVHNTIKTVIPDIPSANGIAYTADYVFVASAPTNSVKIISKATWKIIDSVPSGGKTPDAIYSDPTSTAYSSSMMTPAPWRNSPLPHHSPCWAPPPCRHLPPAPTPARIWAPMWPATTASTKP
jgi:hypothetical protein